MSLLSKSFNKFSYKTQERHKNKLLTLWKSDRFKAPDCLINISKRELNIKEENALRCGLKHRITPKKIDLDAMKVDIEKTVSSAARLDPGDCDSEDEEESNYRHISEDFKDTIKLHLNSFILACKNVCATKVNQLFHKTLSLLSRDKSIKVCNFDKGTGVVVMDSEDYFSKLDNIILDKSKFKEVHVVEGKPHPIISKKNR